MFRHVVACYSLELSRSLLFQLKKLQLERCFVSYDVNASVPTTFTSRAYCTIKVEPVDYKYVHANYATSTSRLRYSYKQALG
jgi:hypothetical protein